jgi:hypothetical protein
MFVRVINTVTISGSKLKFCIKLKLKLKLASSYRNGLSSNSGAGMLFQVVPCLCITDRCLLFFVLFSVYAK